MVLLFTVGNAAIIGFVTMILLMIMNKKLSESATKAEKRLVDLR